MNKDQRGRPRACAGHQPATRLSAWLPPLAIAIAVALAGCGGGSNGDAASGAAAADRSARAAPQAAAPVDDAALAGRWSAVAAWPFIPVHATLTPDGRVFTYGSTPTGGQGSQLSYDVWDPGLGLGADAHLTLPNGTSVDSFCSASLLMPQSGRVISTSGDMNALPGGANNPNRNRSVVALDARDHKLSRLERPIHHQRWYGSLTMSANGETVLQGGTCEGGPQASCDFPETRHAVTPEVYRPGQGWQALTGARSDLYFGGSTGWYYPRSWVAPDGRLFGISSGLHLYYLDTRGDGSITDAGRLDGAQAGVDYAAVMYQPGRILVLGGGSNAASTIDINGPRPVVTPTSALAYRRHWGNATVLPDGQVFAVGGSAVANRLDGVAYRGEIWNPQTGAWTLTAPMARWRLYHSVSILLPDGRVLVGGGGAVSDAPSNELNAEVYSPPYLFKADGSPAVRPELGPAPAQLTWGQAFTVPVTSGAPIRQVTLVGLGAVTHSTDMGQRFIGLGFTTSGGSLRITAPASNRVAPPGFYMLHAIDDRGVPSVARIVRLIDGTTVTSPDQDADPNVVVNGSFENNKVVRNNPSGPDGWSYERVSGWTHPAPGGDINVYQGWAGYAAAQGASYVQIDGRDHRSDGLTQTVRTVPGKVYNFSYAYAARPGVPAATNGVGVYWNGNLIEVLWPDGSGRSQPNWQRRLYGVQGTGWDVVGFKEFGTDDGLGALIDNVVIEPAAPPDRLVNGGFESNTTPDRSAANVAVAGWGNLAGGIELWKNFGGYAAAEGTSWIELDTRANAADAVFQDVRTQAGRSYLLSFQHAARPGAPASTTRFDVVWNGRVIDTLAPDGRGLNAPAWAMKTWTVQGTGAVDRLMFRDTGTDDGTGVLLDNVTLIER